MLTRPDEALPAKQRRIESLIKQIPESLEAGAAAEAASVAAKKASESELPAAAKVCFADWGYASRPLL